MPIARSTTSKATYYRVPLQLSAYSRILLTLGVGGCRDQQLAEDGVVDYGNDHYTCFQFAFDWRRDIVESAQDLHRYVMSRRRFVQRKIEENFGIKDYDVKINLIAHSMGGLLARYFLMYGDSDLPSDGSVPAPNWQGARYIRKVILIGTPNAGSVNSLSILVHGTKLGPGLPKYDAAILGTMTSGYELLPRTRHGGVVDSNDQRKPIDLFDIEIWKQCRWGLLNPEQDRVLRWLLPEVGSAQSRCEIALEHLAKNLARVRQILAALDQSAAQPDGLSYKLFAAD